MLENMSLFSQVCRLKVFFSPNMKFHCCRINDAIIRQVCCVSEHIVFVHLQVDNDQGLLMKCKTDEYPSPSAESSLKRQTATAHLKGPVQTKITQRKETHLQQNGKDQGEEMKGATLLSQKSFQTSTYHHQLSSQTQQLSQPFSNHSRSSTVPSNTSTDGLKVSCISFQHT